jgi:ASC-1-like (ASCH) protein
MEHLAIMKKSWGLLPKIITGEKTIESRWYKNKYAPWNKIAKGDIVYFKNFGERVSINAIVANVLQFSNLTPTKTRKILTKYGSRDGIPKNEVAKYCKIFKDKKYCLLVFLKNPKKIIPFKINKTGFGAMSAWIVVENMNQIKQ